MRIQETIVNIIFDAGKGRASVSSREGVSGEPYGELPRATRSGYTFRGWYLNGREITAETVLDSEEDVRLTAMWEKQSASDRKPSVLRRQKTVAIVLAACILFLGIAIAVAGNLVSIYYIREGDERYTLKRKDGLYCLYNRDGVEMELIKEHSYQSSTDGVYYNVYEVASGNQYMINTSTGEYEVFAVVDTEEGELLGGTVKNKRVMMFPRVGQDNTYSITVTNEYGTYEFYRENVANADTSSGKKYTTEVRIRGLEDTMAAYDPTLFASLCVSCGYTLTMQKLDFSDPEAPRGGDGQIRLEDYGLAEPSATYNIVKAVYAADGSCAPSEESYTVYVGDAILSGGGYYVQLEGRPDRVYIVSADIGNTVLQPVESMVTPSVVYPMTMTTYVMLEDFLLGYMDGKYENLPKETKDLAKDSRVDPMAYFTFEDLSVRENSIKSSEPYINNLSIMKGYSLNNNNVSVVLERIYSMEFLKCIKINPTEEDLAKYNLLEDVYFIHYKYDPNIANGGSNIKLQNTVRISQRTKDGTHYLYSEMYDMIVEVDKYYVSFLDWDESAWYNQYFFQNNIAYMEGLSFTVDGKEYTFGFDNSRSYVYYDKGDGTGAIVDLSKGTLTPKGDGNYIYTITKTGKKCTAYQMDLSKAYLDSKTGSVVYSGPGDNGPVTVQVSLSSSNLMVYSNQYTENGGWMDYEITVKEDSGYTGVAKDKTYTATDNFRRLYSKLLWLSIEGDADEADFDEGIAKYIAANSAKVTISYSLEDMASILNPNAFKTNNTKSATIRFYEYPNSERKMLLTIQTSDSSEELGAFYVLASEVEDLGEYLNDLVNGVLLPKST